MAYVVHYHGTPDLINPHSGILVLEAVSCVHVMPRCGVSTRLRCTFPATRMSGSIDHRRKLSQAPSDVCIYAKFVHILSYPIGSG